MNIPLCVDLDGTLILSDSLFETIMLLIKRNPLMIGFILWWWLRGRAHLKQQVAHRVAFDPTHLPYNQGFLAWLKQQKAAGRQLILVTATDQKIAHAVAKHVGLFDDVIASDGKTNLRSSNKRDALDQRYGKGQYDYAGNSAPDLAVWQHVRQAIVVNASSRLLKQCKKIATIGEVFSRNPLTIKTFLKAIRVHQYTKNLLIFVPLIAGHAFFEGETVSATLLGFICFCLVASSVYLLNDLLDLSADRQHPKKQHRAIASGLLPIPCALLLVATFLIAALIITITLPSAFSIFLLSYLLITLSYSWYFKQQLLIDVCILAGLYTLRIIAGMALINQAYSQWLLLFSIFLFLSLAFVKRYTELHALAQRKTHTIAQGRGYHITHLPIISVFGVVSGYIAAMIFALYLNSPNATLLYNMPELLWLICPIIVYWISRIWLLTTEGKIDDDPILFALKDKVTYALLLVILMIGIAAAV